MKKVLLLAAVAMLSVALSAGDELLKFVPKDVDVVVSVNAEKIINLPLFKDMREKADFQKDYKDLELKLKKYGYKPEQVLKSAAFFGAKDGESGLVADTAVKEATLEKMIKDGLFTEHVKVETKTIKGRKVFVATPVSPADVVKNNMLTYLNPNVVLIADSKDFENILAATAKGNVTANKDLMARKTAVSKDAVIWAVFDLPKSGQPAAAPAGPMGGNPADQISGGCVAVSFIGKDSNDIDLDATIECIDEKSANQTSMQVNMMKMMLVPQAFKGNPQLGMEMSNALNVTPQGKILKAKVSVPKALQDKIKAHVEKMKNQPAPAAPPAPAVGTTKGNSEPGKCCPLTR
jgi:hypothetical protein